MPVPSCEGKFRLVPALLECTYCVSRAVSVFNWHMMDCRTVSNLKLLPSLRVVPQLYCLVSGHFDLFVHVNPTPLHNALFHVGISHYKMFIPCNY